MINTGCPRPPTRPERALTSKVTIYGWSTNQWTSRWKVAAAAAQSSITEIGVCIPRVWSPYDA
jgi:hypothetical protein